MCREDIRPKCEDLSDPSDCLINLAYKVFRSPLTSLSIPIGGGIELSNRFGMEVNLSDAAHESVPRRASSLRSTGLSKLYLP